MSVASPPRGVGPLLRDWRQRRRMSQLDLAVDAEVSARHLSFVETGRSTPSRELVLHLADHLEVPLRDRNSLLLAAGYAPTYHETPMDAGEMKPVRVALERILAGHAPFPAVVIDRHWNLVSANQPAMAILAEGVDPRLLDPPANALRVTLHPDGLAPRIRNLAEYSAHLLERLDRLVAATADPGLIALRDELGGYPGVAPATRPPAAGAVPDTVSRLFVPFVLRSGGTDLTFFSTIATFGTAHDITVAELSIESFFPADEATAAVLRASWG
ncbi:MAG: helix-turn-helix domain-containing protein [Acidimicrobiales bacterium]